MRLPRVTMVILVLAVAACGGRDKDVTLTKIRKTGNGPDEFSVLPSKPLQTPADYTALPAPTPGTANLVDATPKADGVAALGGNPSALALTSVPGRDAALVNYSNRHGGNAAIRQVLALEDAETRRRHGRVNILNLGPTDDYTDAYKRQWLDAHAEHNRLRNLGIQTPTAPPPSE